MLGAMRTEAPRKVAVAYDTLEAGRQMLAWAARFCLQRNDELHLVQYNKVGQCCHDAYRNARYSHLWNPAEMQSCSDSGKFLEQVVIACASGCSTEGRQWWRP